MKNNPEQISYTTQELLSFFHDIACKEGELEQLVLKKNNCNDEIEEALNKIQHFTFLCLMSIQPTSEKHEPYYMDETITAVEEAKKLIEKTVMIIDEPVPGEGEREAARIWFNATFKNRLEIEDEQQA